MWRQPISAFVTKDRRYLTLSCGHVAERRKEDPVANELACAQCRWEAENDDTREDRTNTTTEPHNEGDSHC